MQTLAKTEFLNKMIKPRDLHRLEISFNASAGSVKELLLKLEESRKEAKTEAGRKMLASWYDVVAALFVNYEFSIIELKSLNFEALQQYNDPSQNPESLKKEVAHLQKLVVRYRELLKDNGIKYHTQ